MKKLISFFKGDVARIVFALIFFITAVILEQNQLLYLSLAFYLAALLICGGEVFLGAVKGLLRRDLLDEKFLMSLASIGAMIVGEWSEGVAVMLFFLVGETFEHYAVRRSRSSIRALMDICPDEASVLIDGEEEEMDAEDVEIGSIIVIRPGERVPIDSVVVFGSADVDISLKTVYFTQERSDCRVTRRRREFWLLSRMPTKTNPARRALLRNSPVTTLPRL